MSGELKEIIDSVLAKLPMYLIFGAAAIGIAVNGYGLIQSIRRRRNNDTNPNSFNQSTENNSMARIEPADPQRQIMTLDRLMHDPVDDDYDFDTYNLNTKIKSLYNTSDGYVGILNDGHSEAPFYYENTGDIADDSLAALLMNHSIDNDQLLTLQVSAEERDDLSKIISVHELKGNIGVYVYKTDDFEE